LGLLIPEHDMMPDLVGSTEAALTTSALRVVQLARGRNAIVLIIPSRRLWVGKKADQAEAARLHEAFIKKLKDSGMIVVDLSGRTSQASLSLISATTPCLLGTIEYSPPPPDESKNRRRRSGARLSPNSEGHRCLMRSWPMRTTKPVSSG
jgi:hypothetical protein